jgi:hypothetical protein
VVEDLQAVDDDGRDPAPDAVRVVVGAGLQPALDRDQAAEAEILADELGCLAEGCALVELGVLVFAAVGRDPEVDEVGESWRAGAAVSMDTTFSWWADACVPGLRTAEVPVDGQSSSCR